MVDLGLVAAHDFWLCIVIVAQRNVFAVIALLCVGTEYGGGHENIAIRSASAPTIREVLKRFIGFLH